MRQILAIILVPILVLACAGTADSVRDVQDAIEVRAQAVDQTAADMAEAVDRIGVALRMTEGAARALCQGYAITCDPLVRATAQARQALGMAQAAIEAYKEGRAAYSDAAEAVSECIRAVSRLQDLIERLAKRVT